MCRNVKVWSEGTTGSGFEGRSGPGAKIVSSKRACGLDDAAVGVAARNDNKRPAVTRPAEAHLPPLVLFERRNIVTFKPKQSTDKGDDTMMLDESE